MFLKFLLLVLAVSTVWFGFRAWERQNRLANGERKTGERRFSERLRKSLRQKKTASPDSGYIEETEACPTCGAFVSVEGISNCGKSDCPY